MGNWLYPDMSLEDLLKVTKGFIDMLILASGYQSSGRLAHWDSPNIKKAFQWALFLENVFRGLRLSDEYQGSVEEIDAALSEMTSNPYFPQGLRHISSVSLSQARALMLKHLVQTLPLRDSHLRAAVIAITEIDIDKLRRIPGDCLHVYLERFVHDAPSNPILTGTNCFKEDSTTASPDTNFRELQSRLDGAIAQCAVQEFRSRQLAVSCISAAETGLDLLSNIINKSNCNEVGTTICGEQLQHVTASMSEERPVEPVIWNHWKSRSLSYLLNKRTIRLAAGANLLFSAPKHQLADVLERLSMSPETDDDMCEKIELLLLGSIVQRWSSMISTLMSSSYESLTISKLYQEVQNLPLARFHNLFSKEDAYPEENGSLENLEKYLSNQVHLLWKFLPILAAIAIPSRSLMFRSYLSELESQIRGNCSTIRCCDCTTQGKEHRECEVAERIWCLYIFHVRGPW